MHKTILIAAALMITLGAAAQPGDQMKAYPGQWRSKHPMEAPKLPEIKLQ